ncbi:MAG: hypothetical protein ACRDAU_10920 [Clostridium sp.]
MNKFQKKSMRLFFLGLVVVIVAAIGILLSIVTGFATNLGFRSQYGYASDIGIAGAVIIGATFCIFIFRRVVRYLDMDELLDALLKLGIKILQKIHIPLAMIGFAVISFHVYIFINLGFKWTLGYVFGALAAIDLLILIISGVLRIFNKGIKSHKVLGMILLVLTIIHIILVKYFPLLML